MPLLKSFKYAFLGIGYCIKNERNMRIHIIIALYALYFSRYYSFSKVQYAVLCMLFALVITMEMINTSIEKLVDISAPGFDFKAKAAKDIAAGAVCVCAIFSIIIGVLFYFDLDTLKFIAQDTLFNPVRLISFLGSTVLAVLFSIYGLAQKKI